MKTTQKQMYTSIQQQTAEWEKPQTNLIKALLTVTGLVFVCRKEKCAKGVIIRHASKFRHV